jgi:hypothetical protein
MRTIGTNWCPESNIEKLRKLTDELPVMDLGGKISGGRSGPAPAAYPGGAADDTDK